MRLQSTRCKPLWSIPTRFASCKTLYSNASQPFDTPLRCCYRTSTTIQLKCKPFSICIFEPIFSYDEMCMFMCCTPSFCASTPCSSFSSPVPSVHANAILQLSHRCPVCRQCQTRRRSVQRLHVRGAICTRARCFFFVFITESVGYCFGDAGLFGASVYCSGLQRFHAKGILCQCEMMFLCFFSKLQLRTYRHPLGMCSTTLAPFLFTFHFN